MNLLIPITLILILTVLFLPRRWAVLGILLGVLYLTQGQFLSPGGINLYPVRAITFAGFVRVMARKEFSFSKLTEIDKRLFIFLSIYLFVFLLRALLVPGRHSTLVAHQVGTFLDGLTTYISFRALLKTAREFKQFLRDVAISLLPFTIFMAIESLTGRSSFIAMGAIRELSVFRNGSFRSQASFRHAITAGTVGATFIPLLVGLWFSSSKRVIAGMGLLFCVSIIISSHSSGPLLTFFAGILAWSFWPFRSKMYIVQLSFVVFVILLDILMTGRFWFITARMSELIGGDGWHRANLISKFFENFGEWWLIGMTFEKTANWAATQMPWGGVDVTNEYIYLGINGGLISLVLFVRLLWSCYRNLGRAVKMGRVGKEAQKKQMFLWGLGCTLFAHMVNLLAVSYWDQSYVLWYMLLAVISSLTAYSLRGGPKIAENSNRPFIVPLFTSRNQRDL